MKSSRIHLKQSPSKCHTVCSRRCTKWFCTVLADVGTRWAGSKYELVTVVAIAICTCSTATMCAALMCYRWCWTFFPCTWPKKSCALLLCMSQHCATKEKEIRIEIKHMCSWKKKTFLTFKFLYTNLFQNIRLKYLKSIRVSETKKNIKTVNRIVRNRMKCLSGQDDKIFLYPMNGDGTCVALPCARSGRIATGWEWPWITLASNTYSHSSCSAFKVPHFLIPFYIYICMYVFHILTYIFHK